jgi:hypothetical protein
MVSRNTRRRFNSFLQGSGGRAVVAALAFGLTGLLIIQFTSAETLVSNSEAETGIVSGAASKINDASASNGLSVSFGATTPAPTNVQAITGGNSIALIWDMPRINVKTVEVYRNNALVSTITPGTGVVKGDKNGTRYIDKNVTAGTSYTYKVRLTTQGSNVSAFSNDVVATRPTSTTPVPVVTIDASQATDLTDYLNTYAKAEIETWYPKISDAIAYPAYTPIHNIKIVMDTTNTGVANASYTTGVISVNPTWLRDNLQDGGGMFVHESTHILQAYPGSDTTGWATEGLADWTRDWFTRERFYIPPPNAQLGGYMPGGLTAQWAQAKYDPSFVRKLNIALHNNTYTSSFIPNLTNGRSATQLFAEAKQSQYGGNGTIRNAAGKCIEVQDNSDAAGAKLQLATCGSNAGQQWNTIYRDAGLHGTTKQIIHFDNGAVTPEGRCIDVYGFATTSGATVWSWQCNFETNQEWTKTADGSLMSPYSDKCLSSANDDTTNGAQIVIATCDGTPAQHWTFSN